MNDNRTLRVVAIVQARMGSSRLPGKVLLPLAGEPMLARVVGRTRRATGISDVMIATSTLPTDDPIAALCDARGWSCFRGLENDVLARYHGAAREAAADAIVRITADCPLLDPGVLGALIGAFLAGQPGLDYVCNFHPRRTFPRGLDCEIFRRDVLERCHAEATDLASREHVTAFIYRHPEKFRLHGIESAQDESAHRWTVDTPEDFALIERIYQHFGHDHFGWLEVLSLLRTHPEWRALNAHIEQKAH